MLGREGGDGDVLTCWRVDVLMFFVLLFLIAERTIFIFGCIVHMYVLRSVSCIFVFF